MADSLFPSLRSMRQKAEDRAPRYDQLAETDEQYLALVKINPHVLLALLDVVEAAKECNHLDHVWKTMNEDAPPNRLARALRRFE